MDRQQTYYSLNFLSLKNLTKTFSNSNTLKDDTNLNTYLGVSDIWDDGSNLYMYL